MFYLFIHPKPFLLLGTQSRGCGHSHLCCARLAGATLMLGAMTSIVPVVARISYLVT